jgi:hypothetical protein
MDNLFIFGIFKKLGIFKELEFDGDGTDNLLIFIFDKFKVLGIFEVQEGMDDKLSILNGIGIFLLFDILDVSVLGIRNDDDVVNIFLAFIKASNCFCIFFCRSVIFEELKLLNDDDGSVDGVALLILILLSLDIVVEVTVEVEIGILLSIDLVLAIKVEFTVEIVEIGLRLLVLLKI